jgi:hypothetical protein
MSTPTPTPLTDAYEYKAGWAAANYGERWKPMDFARELERELNAEREKAERYRLATLKLDAQIADWSVLNAWGGTPEIIHKFVKGQQARIHYCQNIEEDLVAERARLDSGTILLTVAGERVWHCGVDLRAAIDAAMKEGAK